MMATSFHLLGIILEITFIAAIELWFTPDPPTLNIYGTHRMNKSDNLELTCRGRQYLKWTIPRTSPRISSSDCSGSGLFCTRLTITNATANETGQYRCSYRDLSVEDGKTAAAVYVFVHDYKVPFVPPEKEYEVVFIREGERVVIPCRGSVENLNVTLNTKYPMKEIHPDGKDSVWDAKTGFTIPTHLISYAGVVSCQTRIGNETFNSPLYIVAVVGYKIYDLTVTPLQQRLSVEERLILSCTAHTELNVGIEFNWTHSRGALNLDNGLRLSHTVSQKKKLWNSLELSNTLIVENVTVNHTGEFTCVASSGQMEKRASAYLKVYEKPFIDIKEPWTKVWEVNLVGDQTSTLIPVIYSAYPEPSFKWLKNGEALKDDYRIKQKSDALIIHRVTEMDAGNYTVILINKMTKEEQRRSVHLLVNVRPRIIEKEMATDNDVYEYGKSPTLRCTAYGFPIPEHMQWQWMSKEDCPQVFISGLPKTDIQMEKCTGWRNITSSHGDKLVEITNHVDRAQKKLSSSLKIQKAEAHALYRCTTANKVGEDSRIIVFSVTRNIEVSMSPSDKPMEGDNVILRCKADKLIYSNLTWLFFANMSKSVDLAQPCHSLTPQPKPLLQAVRSTVQGTNITLELMLPNATHQDDGLYACQVVNIKTSMRTCILRHLSLRDLEAAKIRNNFTNQKVNMSATVTLQCDAVGTPNPTVVWTKNNQTMEKGSGVILNQHNLTIQRVKKEDSGLYTCTACNSHGCDSSWAYLTVEG
ncbi:vascular endothelial growth factor receptor 2, partial [Austrofundulus limnaeus]|uniref:Vascular endothelial growth factor receptor 2 n=1 Tax=Austrofundulus limnaeus TaxID=52670 RepID=A0A2I4DCM4_AUSLI